MRMRFMLAALVTLGLAGPAMAAPVTWTFQNAVFNDGTSLTGSFVFDADVPFSPFVGVPGVGGPYSDLDLATENGPALTGVAYQGAPLIQIALPPEFPTAFFTTSSGGLGVGEQGLFISLADVPTGAGGTIDLLLQDPSTGSPLSFEGVCVDVDCADEPTLFRELVSGSVTTDIGAVPLPAGFPLMLTGALAFAALRRLRARA